MAERPPQEVDFYEIAPENWIGMGGVNNIHVNAVNHGCDARASWPPCRGERVRYGHIAGHYVEAASRSPRTCSRV